MIYLKHTIKDPDSVVGLYFSGWILFVFLNLCLEGQHFIPRDAVNQSGILKPHPYEGSLCSRLVEEGTLSDVVISTTTS